MQSPVVVDHDHHKEICKHGEYKFKPFTQLMISYMLHFARFAVFVCWCIFIFCVIIFCKCTNFKRMNLQREWHKFVFNLDCLFFEIILSLGFNLLTFIFQEKKILIPKLTWEQYLSQIMQESGLQLVNRGKNWALRKHKPNIIDYDISNENLQLNNMNYLFYFVNIDYKDIIKLAPNTVNNHFNNGDNYYNASVFLTKLSFEIFELLFVSKTFDPIMQNPKLYPILSFIIISTTNVITNHNCNNDAGSCMYMYSNTSIIENDLSQNSIARIDTAETIDMYNYEMNRIQYKYIASYDVFYDCAHENEIGIWYCKRNTCLLITLLISSLIVDFVDASVISFLYLTLWYSTLIGIVTYVFMDTLCAEPWPRVYSKAFVHSRKLRKLKKFASSKMVYTKIHRYRPLPDDDGDIGDEEWITEDQQGWKNEYYIRCVIIKHCDVFDYILRYFHTKLIILDCLASLNKNQQLFMLDIIVSYMFDINYDMRMLNSNSNEIGFDIEVSHIPKVLDANQKQVDTFDKFMADIKKDMKLCLSNHRKQISSILCDVKFAKVLEKV